MKKISFAFALMLSATTLFAQNNDEKMPFHRTEVSVSYGVLSNSQLFEILRIFSESIIDYNYEATRFSGALFATIRRSSANNKFRYGIAVGYDGSKGTYTDPVSSSSIPGNYRSSHVTVAGEGLFAYMNKPAVRLYGFIGAGYTNITYKRTRNSSSATETQSDGGFNFQVTPIGVSVGNQFGGFLELGVGYKGVINIGAYVKF